MVPKGALRCSEMKARDRTRGKEFKGGLESFGELEKEPHEAMWFIFLPSSWAAVTSESNTEW